MPKTALSLHKGELLFIELLRQAMPMDGIQEANARRAFRFNCRHNGLPTRKQIQGAVSIYVEGLKEKTSSQV